MKDKSWHQPLTYINTVHTLVYMCNWTYMCSYIHGSMPIHTWAHKPAKLVGKKVKFNIYTYSYNGGSSDTCFAGAFVYGFMGIHPM